MSRIDKNTSEIRSLANELQFRISKSGCSEDEKERLYEITVDILHAARNIVKARSQICESISTLL